MVGRSKILVACSDPETRRALLRILSDFGVEPVMSSTVAEARALLARQWVPLVICSDELADGSFRDLLRAAERQKEHIPVVVASRLDNSAEYIEAMALGAFDFIASPYRHAEFEWILSHALRGAAVAAA